MTDAKLIRDLVSEAPVVLTISEVRKHDAHYDLVGTDKSGTVLKDTCALRKPDQVPVVGEKWSFEKSADGYPVATLVEKQ